MTQTTSTDTSRPVDSTTAPHRSAVRRATALLVAAAVTTVLAALAGLGLLVVDPDPGSTTEGALGVTAAVAGLATGALVIAAVIYAQMRNLWRFTPGWFRLAVLGLVAAGFIRSLIVSFA